MPEPSYSPPADEPFARQQPRQLNRWLDVNPVAKLTRTQRYLTFPLFSVESDWLGYSDIVAAYNYESEKNFTLKPYDIPVNPNYILCVMWKMDGVTHRCKLWEDVGEVFFFDVPLYNGELIMKNFRFEVWSVEPFDLTIFVISSAGTANINGTYTQSTSSLWVKSGAIEINKVGSTTMWTSTEFASIRYFTNYSYGNLPYGYWQVDTGATPLPIVSINTVYSQSSNLTLYTSVRGDRDYMWADDDALTTPSSVITDFTNTFDTFPFAWPANSSPTTN